MLNTLLSSLVKDIAIEGAQGCDIERLWALTERIGQSYITTSTRSNDITFFLDAGYKAYLWQYIRRMKELYFTLVEKSNVKLDLTTFSYEHVKTIYNSSLRITASIKARKRAMTNGKKFGSGLLTALQYKLLGIICTERERGISQNRIRHMLEMDSRSVFHFVKGLETHGLIEKRPSVENGTYTTVCFHVQFISRKSKESNPVNNNSSEASATSNIEDDNALIYHEVVYKNLVAALRGAKENTMALADLMKKVGLVKIKHIRWGRGVVTNLQAKGVVEKIKVQTDKEQVLCVRLLNPLISNEEVLATLTVGTVDSNESKSTFTKRIQPDFYRQPYQSSGCFADLSLEYLLYRFVIDSGEHGVLRGEISDALPIIRTGHLKKMLLRLSNPPKSEIPTPRIYAVKVIIRKTHCIRYFGREGWLGYGKKNDLSLKDDMNGNTEEVILLQESDSIYQRLYTKPMSLPSIKKLIKETSLPPKKKTKSQSTKKTSKLILEDLSETRIESIDETGLEDPTIKIGQTLAPTDTETVLPLQITAKVGTVRPSMKKSTGTLLDFFSSTPSIDTASNVAQGRKRKEPDDEQKTPQEVSESQSLRSRKRPLPKDQLSSLEKNTTVKKGKKSEKSQLSNIKDEKENDHEAPTEDQTIPKVPNICASKTYSSEEMDKNNTTTTAYVPENNKTIKVSKAMEKQNMKKRNSLVCTTTEKRKKIFLSIMARERIADLNKDLMEEIGSKEGTSELNQSISRRTMKSIADKCVDNGELRQIKVLLPELSGNMKPKTIYMLPKITENDEEFKKFVNEERTRKSVHTSYRRYLPVKLVEGEVERVDPGEARVYTSTGYRQCAQAHGWISSPWIRSKLLHIHMHTSLQQINKESRLSLMKTTEIDMVKLYESMPLRLYLKIIGTFKELEGIEQYLETDCPLNELPAEVRKSVVQKERKYRQVMTRLLKILEKLELIKKADSNVDKLYSNYVLVNEGSIRNYSKAGTPIIRTLSLDTLQNTIIFWEDLESICTTVYAVNPRDNVFKANTDDVLYSICLPLTWLSDVLLTVQQRHALNQYVDFDAKTTPLNDIQLIIYIARKHELVIARVKRYYQCLFEDEENRLARKLRNKARTRQRKLRRPICALIKASNQGIKVPSVTHLDRGVHVNSEPTFVGSRKYLKHRINANTIPDDSQPKSFTSWSTLEEDTLIYAYAITKHRCREFRFIWRPIVKLLGKRNPSMCRSYMRRQAKNTPSFAQKINNLIERWGQLYKAGLRSGEIEDPKPYDLRDYDLPGFLAYFIRSIQNDSRIGTVKDPKILWILPKDTQEIEGILGCLKKDILIQEDTLFRFRTHRIYANSITKFDQQNLSPSVEDTRLCVIIFTENIDVIS